MDMSKFPLRDNDYSFLRHMTNILVMKINCRFSICNHMVRKRICLNHLKNLYTHRCRRNDQIYLTLFTIQYHKINIYYLTSLSMYSTYCGSPHMLIRNLLRIHINGHHRRINQSNPMIYSFIKCISIYRTCNPII